MFVKIARYLTFIVTGFLLVGILLFIFFTDSFINIFVKDRIENVLMEKYPAYSIKLGEMHYIILKNKLISDSIFVQAADSALVIKGKAVSVSGINWINILIHRNIRIDAIRDSYLDVEKIEATNSITNYILLLENLRISLSDSLITADSIRYHPSVDDDELFAQSEYRQTRYRLDIPKIKIAGIDYNSLLNENVYKTGNINIYNLNADILVNKDKPFNVKSPDPQMPYEVFSSTSHKIKIDSVNVINGKLKYYERFAVNSIPAFILFDKVNISACSISNINVNKDTVIIHTEGVFMNSSRMKVFMEMPLTTNEFSLRYSGSFSEMDATELNSFIVPSEHHLIKSGIINTALFSINVDSGSAKGGVQIEYENLSIAILNKETESEDGILDQISTFIAKTFIVRENNMPDKNGLMKIGEIRYTRKPGDTFIQFIWFALRNGVGDVVGF